MGTPCGASLVAVGDDWGLKIGDLPDEHNMKTGCEIFKSSKIDEISIPRGGDRTIGKLSV